MSIIYDNGFYSIFKVIEGLENCVNLESLWLGKNKIESITGVSTLVKLRQLDVQNNRLTSLGEELIHLVSLQELYLACNAIENLDGLPIHSPLSTFDLSTNKVRKLDGMQQFSSTLQELWMTSCQVTDLTDLEPLLQLQRLDTLYLEHCPISQIENYRSVIVNLLPTLTQFDATEVTR